MPKRGNAIEYFLQKTFLLRLPLRRTPTKAMILWGVCDLDEWLRHSLRAVQLRHWRWGTTLFGKLRALSISSEQAARAAGNVRHWRRNSRMELNRVMPVAYFAKLGVPRLFLNDLSFSSRPVRTRLLQGLGQVS